MNKKIKKPCYTCTYFWPNNKDGRFHTCSHKTNKIEHIDGWYESWYAEEKNKHGNCELWEMKLNHKIINKIKSFLRRDNEQGN